MLMHQDYRHFKIHSSSKLLQFAPKSPRKSVATLKTSESAKKYEQGYFHYFKDILDEFVSTFTMHGLDRIFKRNLNKYKKLTWIIAFSLCLGVFIYVAGLVTTSYHTKPLVTVVSTTHLPVFEIPFPEVTICNKNRFNWLRINQAKEKFLKPEHQTPEYRDIFVQVVNAYDTLMFGKFYKFANLTKIPQAMLQDLNYVNFSMVSEFMAWKCHEMLSECFWIEDQYNCCDIFFVRNSLLGSCLAFNSIESPEGREKQKKDPLWPWRSKGLGEDHGLWVKVHVREYQHSPITPSKKGIWVMLAEPHVWYTYPIEVNTHTATSISLSAVLHIYDDYTRLFSSKVRQCVFDDERSSMYYKSLPSHPYMFENCQSQCQQEYLLNFCNCTLEIFYPPGPFRICQLSDYPCLFYHNHKLQYFEQIGEAEFVGDYFTDVMKCTCYYNCKSLNYMTKITTAYMNNMDVEFNNSYVDLTLFYQQEYVTEYMTTVQYTWTDLMASFGGLAGLCIGCSLISLVELTYFFLVDIPHKSIVYLKMKKRLRLKKKSVEIRTDIMENIMKN